MPPRPYPEWSWSPSRHNLFQECRRKYYYHYYGAHNGWLAESSVLAREAYRLKQMTNLYLVFGDAVHKMAEETIKQYHHYGQAIEAEELVKRIRRLLNQAYLDSRDVEAWKMQPKHRTMLEEVYYLGSLPDRQVEQIRSRLPILVDRLLKSDSMQLFMYGDGCHLVEMEKLNTIQLHDTKVYVKLDFMFRHQDRYTIVDWKTGQEDERNDTQLRLYGWYVHENYGIPYDRIDIRTEYLLSGRCQLDQVDEPEMESLIDYTQSSINKMQSYLEDVNLNAPKPREAFEVTDDERRCRRCAFREICEGAKAPASNDASDVAL